MDAAKDAEAKRPRIPCGVRRLAVPETSSIWMRQGASKQISQEQQRTYANPMGLPRRWLGMRCSPKLPRGKRFSVVPS